MVERLLINATGLLFEPIGTCDGLGIAFWRTETDDYWNSDRELPLWSW
jgi:hypothetical protein